MKKIYRSNVGIVVCKNGKVLMCARADREEFSWQFPQGGVDDNEDFLKAAKRELFEETGIKSIEVIGRYPKPLRYEFRNGKKKIGNVEYDGQEQTWFLFKFVGDDEEINLNINPNEIEFKDYEWTDIETAPEKIVNFKKNVYKKIVSFFACAVKDCKDE